MGYKHEYMKEIERIKYLYKHLTCIPMTGKHGERMNLERNYTNMTRNSYKEPDYMS